MWLTCLGGQPGEGCGWKEWGRRAETVTERLSLWDLAAAVMILAFAPSEMEATEGFEQRSDVM